MTRRRPTRPSDAGLLRGAVAEAFRKVEPCDQAHNPVMFVVFAGAVLTTVLATRELFALRLSAAGPALAIAFWLWATVLVANFAEALAEGRGKAQVEALRRTREVVVARRLRSAEERIARDLVGTGGWDPVAAAGVRPGDLVFVEAGDTVPCDAVVIDGVAALDESVITGESAPVVRGSGGDRDTVTGGTRVLSGRLILRAAAAPGDAFLDRMIAVVEGARRHRTPFEVALDLVLAALTLLFLLATVTLRPLSEFAVMAAGRGAPASVPLLVALLACLLPTTIGALASVIGIAGADRLIQANVIATSDRAIDRAGEVDVLLLDKTGTITLGSRSAVEMIPAGGVTVAQLADAALLASLADETPEGRSIVVLARERYGVRGPDLQDLGATFVPFTAHTRTSGVDLGHRRVRKGAADAIQRWLEDHKSTLSAGVRATLETVARAGATPLVVAENARVLGVIALKDAVKGGIAERFAQLRAMGVKTVMITGDNPYTAAAIAAEAGVDDFVADATPQAKLALIRDYQARGHRVAMIGDGSDDAPALAQADVAVAMNSGTRAARDAGHMVDLDNNPTKLVEIVEIGRQTRATRGSLTAFSLANDVAKAFVILPVALGAWHGMSAWNVVGLDPRTAVLSALVFDALVILALVPLALRGVPWRPAGVAGGLRAHLWFFGLGGLIAPFVGIKGIDLLLSALQSAL